MPLLAATSTLGLRLSMVVEVLRALRRTPRRPRPRVNNGVQVVPYNTGRQSISLQSVIKKKRNLPHYCSELFLLGLPFSLCESGFPAPVGIWLGENEEAQSGSTTEEERRTSHTGIFPASFWLGSYIIPEQVCATAKHMACCPKLAHARALTAFTSGYAFST